MPRKTSAALTDGEARVMAVLWRLKTATVADVVTPLQAQYRADLQHRPDDAADPGAKGLRGPREGVAARSCSGRWSTSARRAAARLKHLIGRLFNGSPSLLVSNVLDDDDIDPAELARLKKLIEHA